MRKLIKHLPGHFLANIIKLTDWVAACYGVECIALCWFEQSLQNQCGALRWVVVDSMSHTRTSLSFRSRSANSNNRTRTSVSLHTTTSLWKQQRWESIPWSIIRVSVSSWIDLSLSMSLPADERTSGAENPPASTASHWLISLHLIINL